MNREGHHNSWRRDFGNGTLRDFRFALRQLLKSPGFTVVVVLVLGLGIAADTAIFNALDQVLLRPLPVEKPHELVLLEYRWVDEDEGESGVGKTFNYPLYESYRDQPGAFAGLVAFRDWTMNLTVGDAEHQLQGMVVSSNYFAVLGVKPACGSLVLPADNPSSTTESAAVISDRLWRRRFGGDSGVIGTQVMVNGHPVIIAGVAPHRFTGTVVGCMPDLYVPLSAWATMWRRPLSDRSSANWYLLGRLKRGVSREQAQAILRVLAAQIRQVEPNNTHTEVLVSNGSRGPVNERSREGRVPILLLMITASFVLLIACANVANMQLARAVTRQKEIAMRQALGASHGRIIRQLLVENLVMALVGGVCGVLLATWFDQLLCLVVAAISSVHVVAGLNGRVLLFALAISLMTGITFGLAPALRTPPTLANALRETTSLASRWTLHSLLVIAQMAGSTIVLVCGGLCLYSLLQVRWMDPGFDPTRVVAVSIDGRQKQASTRQLLEDLQSRVAQMPRVESVSLAGRIPLISGGGYTTGVKRLEGRNIAAGEEIIVEHAFVSPGYFRTLGLALLNGRDIAEQDVPGSAAVMVVNEIMARRCWPGQDPIGKHITFFGPGPDGEDTVEVIGMVKAAKHDSIHDELKPVVYRSLAQVPDDQPVLLARVTHDPGTVSDDIRKMAMSLGVPESACDVRTIAQRQWGQYQPQQVLTGIVNVFGLVVLVLCATGVYGVTSYAVRQRTREIGIRIALGARRHDILALVLLKGATLAAAGLSLGIGLSLVAMRFLQHSLPELHAWDPNFLAGASPWHPLPYACAAMVLALAAFTACYLPARRAAAIDPMTTLRCE